MHSTRQRGLNTGTIQKRFSNGSCIRPCKRMETNNLFHQIIGSQRNHGIETQATGYNSLSLKRDFCGLFYYLRTNGAK